MIKVWLGIGDCSTWLRLWEDWLIKQHKPQVRYMPIHHHCLNTLTFHITGRTTSRNGVEHWGWLYIGMCRTYTIIQHILNLLILL